MLKQYNKAFKSDCAHCCLLHYNLIDRYDHTALDVKKVIMLEGINHETVTKAIDSTGI